MNDIVEINYPNLDNYFKNLAVIQEDYWENYWPESKSIIMKNVRFLVIASFLLYTAKILMEVTTENSLLYFLSQLYSALGAVGAAVIITLALSNLLQLLLDYAECKQYFKSRLMRKQTETHLKLLDDFPCYISTSHLELNSKGIITGINKENSLLRQKLENYLQNKSKEIA
jgi:hypothetical protein